MKTVLRLLLSFTFVFTSAALPFPASAEGDAPAFDLFSGQGTALEGVTEADIGGVFPLIYNNGNGITYDLTVQFVGYVDYDGQKIPYFQVAEYNDISISVDPKTPGSGGSAAGSAAPSGGGPSNAGAGSGTGTDSGFGVGDGISFGVLGFGAINSFNGSVGNAGRIHDALRDGLRSNLDFSKAHSRAMSQSAKDMTKFSGQLRARNAANSGMMSRALNKHAGVRNLGTAAPKGTEPFDTSLLNPDGVLDLKKAPFPVRENPLTGYRFATPAQTTEGKLLRQIANEFQLEWMNQRGFDMQSPVVRDLYNSGLHALFSADEAFAGGALSVGFNLSRSASIVLDIVRGLKDGAVQAIEDLATSAPRLAKVLLDLNYNLKHNPQQVITDIQKFYNQMPQIRAAIQKDLLAKWEVIKSGSAYERSVLTGRIATDVIVARGAGKVWGWAAEGVEVGSAASRTAGAVARGAQTAKTIGNGTFEHYLRGEAFKDVVKSKDFLNKVGRLKAAENALARQGLNLSTETKEFLASKVAYEGATLSPGQLQNLGNIRSGLEKALPHVPRSSLDDTIWRAIPSKIEAGNMVELYPGKGGAFEFPMKSFFNDNRFSMPGETGLYGVIGKSRAVVEKTLVAEMKGVPLSDLLIESKRFASSRVLDLRNPSVLRSLGISADDIAGDLYDLPHAIGNAARQNGFEAIIFPSSKTGVPNIVIF